MQRPSASTPADLVVEVSSARLHTVQVKDLQKYLNDYHSHLRRAESKFISRFSGAQNALLYALIVYGDAVECH